MTCPKCGKEMAFLSEARTWLCWLKDDQGEVCQVAIEVREKVAQFDPTQNQP